MLQVLQYFAIIAALALPWTIGGIIKFSKNGDRKKLTVAAILCAAMVLILAFVVYIAFGINNQ